MGHAEADAGGVLAGHLVADLLRLPPEERRPWYRQLAPKEMGVVLTRCRKDLGSPYGLWQDDPVGFCQDVLGDTTYSIQERLMESVRDHPRTAAPATHAPGKTFTGGRLVCWWVSVWPLGTAQAITTAPKLRQVKNIMWPGIRRAHAAGNLPGEVLTTMWKIGEEPVAYGFSAADWDEEAVQGIHAPHVLFIVDEAGGIGHVLGASYAAVMSQPHARMLMIGNPPTDEEGTWFELQAEKAEHLVHTVRIPAFATPNFTGEVTGFCTSCPPGAPPHRVATHLTTQEWVDEVVAEFGQDSAFYEARVLANFPAAIGQKVMPYSWVESCAETEHEAASGQWVRLGVDIASDGGDEFVIGRGVGFNLSIPYRSSGAANADPVNLQARIMEHVREALEIRARIKDPRVVHVKIDASGLGWAVAGNVKRQVEEKGWPALVLPVRGEDEPNDETQFKNARSELWWNMRRLVKPLTDPASGAVLSPGKVKFVDVPVAALAQLSAPKYGNDSQGRIVVEKKRETKRRMGGSPDLADALNLVVYEPPGISPARLERAATRMPTGYRAQRGRNSPGLAPRATPPSRSVRKMPLGPPRSERPPRVRP